MFLQSACPVRITRLLKQLAKMNVEMFGTCHICKIMTAQSLEDSGNMPFASGRTLDVEQKGVLLHLSM